MPDTHPTDRAHHPAPPQGRKYSARLGVLTDAQLAAAVARHGLGRFLGAAPVQGGLFGQNLFLHTSAGEFVLRGAPHWVDGAPNDHWQFTQEAFFAEQLHLHTDVPAPWPQWRDRDADLFGWPYVIMPRLAGTCLATEDAVNACTPADHQGIARALGEGLARLQQLRWPYAGAMDIHGRIAAFPGGHAGHLADDLQAMVDGARDHGALNDGDRAWIDGIIHAGRVAAGAALAGVAETTFVHADYALGNVVLTPADPRTGTPWRLAGVFDLHTACFGMPLLDLCRTAASYVDRDPALAATFIGAWRAARQAAPPSAALFALCLANERMKIWAYFTRPELGDSAVRRRLLRTDFEGFAGPYLARLLPLLDAGATRYAGHV